MRWTYGFIGVDNVRDRVRFSVRRQRPRQATASADGPGTRLRPRKTAHCPSQPPRIRSTATAPAHGFGPGPGQWHRTTVNRIRIHAGVSWEQPPDFCKIGACRTS